VYCSISGVTLSIVLRSVIVFRLVGGASNSQVKHTQHNSKFESQYIDGQYFWLLRSATLTLTGGFRMVL
jgi:hypothetical protein